MNKNKIIFFCKLVVAISLTVLLFSFVDWHLFLHTLSNGNVFALSLGVIFFGINIVLSVFRWSLATHYFGIPENKTQLFRLYLIGTYFNNFLPSSVGGDGYKYIFLQKKYPFQKKEIFSSLIFDRGMGLLALFGFNIILLIISFDRIISNSQLLYLELIILSFVLVGIVLLFLIKYFQKYIKEICDKFNFLQKLFNIVMTFLSLKKKSIIISGFFYSLVFVLIGAFWQWTYLYAFGFQVNFIYLIFSFTIIQIAGVVPISFNALGIYEGLSVFLYGQAGVPIETALAVALVSRCVLTFLSLSGVIFYLKNNN